MWPLTFSRYFKNARSTSVITPALAQRNQFGLAVLQALPDAAPKLQTCLERLSTTFYPACPVSTAEIILPRVSAGSTVTIAGGSLTAVAIVGAGVLLSEKPELGSWPGVLSILSDFGGHPQQVILAQIKTVMTSVLS